MTTNIKDTTVIVVPQADKQDRVRGVLSILDLDFHVVADDVNDVCVVVLPVAQWCHAHSALQANGWI